MFAGLPLLALSWPGITFCNAAAVDYDFWLSYVAGYSGGDGYLALSSRGNPVIYTLRGHQLFCLLSVCQVYHVLGELTLSLSPATAVSLSSSDHTVSVGCESIATFGIAPFLDLYGFGALTHRAALLACLIGPSAFHGIPNCIDCGTIIGWLLADGYMHTPDVRNKTSLSYLFAISLSTNNDHGVLLSWLESYGGYGDVASYYLYGDQTVYNVPFLLILESVSLWINVLPPAPISVQLLVAVAANHISMQIDSGYYAAGKRRRHPKQKVGSRSVGAIYVLVCIALFAWAYSAYASLQCAPSVFITTNGAVPPKSTELWKELQDPKSSMHALMLLSHLFITMMFATPITAASLSATIDKLNAIHKLRTAAEWEILREKACEARTILNAKAVDKKWKLASMTDRDSKSLGSASTILFNSSFSSCYGGSNNACQNNNSASDELD